MITTLLPTTYKAVKKVYSPSSKLPKHYKEIPVFHTVLLTTDNGYLRVVSVSWNNENSELEKTIECIPARIENDFSVCVPARAFYNWLSVSQLTKEEKAKGQSEQMVFAFDPTMQNLTIRAGNTKVTFKGIDALEFPNTHKKTTN